MPKWSLVFLRSCLYFSIVSTPLFFYQNCGQGLETIEQSSELSTSELKSLGIDVAETNPPVIMDDHPDITTSLKVIELEAEPILADRRYLRKILADAFGPSAFVGAINPTGIHLTDNQIDFGDPCSIYRQYRVQNNSGTFNVALVGENCSIDPGARGLGGPRLNSVTVSQFGWMHQNCLNLVENPTTFAFALTKMDATKENPDLTPQNMLKLFKQFYRDKPEPSPALLDSLFLLMNSSDTSSERWKAPLYQICTSGHWMLL